mgnify:CR=1 FL=1
MAKAQTELSDLLDGERSVSGAECDEAIAVLRVKYDIPDGVYLFTEFDDTGMIEGQTGIASKYISAFVKGQMTEDAFYHMCFWFEEIAECDYGWILIERPMHFYGEEGVGPSVTEIEKELQTIGCRSQKKCRTLPPLFKFKVRSSPQQNCQPGGVAAHSPTTPLTDSGNAAVKSP